MSQGLKNSDEHLKLSRIRRDVDKGFHTNTRGKTAPESGLPCTQKDRRRNPILNIRKSKSDMVKH